jgi:MFS family permease
MVLFLPFGATAGFVSVTIGYIAKQHGLGDAAIAGLVALNTLPHTFKFFWAPIPDALFTRRGWYVAANLTSTATLMGLGLVPVTVDTVTLLRVLVLVNSVAITFLGMSVEGLLGQTVDEEQRGSAAGWLQAGNLGGAGIGGGVALFLAQRLGAPAAFILVALGLLLCSLALLLVKEPKAPRHGSVLAGLRHAVVDTVETIVQTRTGALAMLVCFLPAGAAAASALFSAMAGRWNTSADAVALYTGVLGGVVAAVGCMAGGWLSDRMDRKTAYSLTGFLLAAVAVGMYFGPRSERGYGVFTLAYQFGAGMAYGAFTGFVLEAIGRGAVATKYNALASLSNIPIWYMTEVDGRVSERWGAPIMLLADAASEVLGAVIFLLAAYYLVWRPVRAAAAVVPQLR